jgi:prepilin-type N-terminal cleavage/methylation domain-containing protein
MMPTSIPSSVRRVRRWSAAGGFSLIELMVALTLGLLLVAAAATLFVNGRSNFRQDVAISAVQDNSRFAIAQLEEDAAMAGYWSEMFDPANITIDTSIPSSSASDCTAAAGFGGAFGGFLNSGAKSYGTVMYPIAALNNATATQANAAFPCISASEFQAGTDILLVRRLVGLNVADSVVTSAASAGQIYLRENGTQGTIFAVTSTPANPPPGPISTVTAPDYNWPYRISLFYIRNYSVTAGDGIPTLCRKYLASTTGGWTSDCAAEGIENLQVEFGINTSLAAASCAALTGAITVAAPNYYTSSPSLTELAQAVTARISILARASTQDFKYSNTKTYTVGNSPAYSPGDNYHRQLVVSDVFLRNPVGLALSKCNGF